MASEEGGLKSSTDEYLANILGSMNRMLVDLDGMKERQNMFESILLGSKTLPKKTPSKEKEEIGLNNSKGKKSKNGVESMKSENADFEEESSVVDVDVASSSSSHSSEDSSSDSGKESDDENVGELFGSLFGEKKQFNSVNQKRGSSPKKVTKESKNRKSVMFMDAKKADEMQSIASKNHYTRIQPDFEHIKLEKLNPPAVIRFLRDLSEYQEKHGISLRAGTLIDKKIINDLMADNHVFEWDYKTFYNSSTVEILHLLQDAMKPKSREAFMQQLTAYLDFKVPSNYSATVTNFKPLYRALLTYRTEFKQLYDFMSYENKRNIPPCNNKPGGLVKLFVSKVVPQRFAESIVNGMDKSSFQHIDDFFMVFYKKVQRAYDVYLKAKDASYLLGESASYTTGSAKGHHLSSTPGNSTAPRKFSSSYSDSSKRDGKHTLTGRINALSARLVEDSDTDGSDNGLSKTGGYTSENNNEDDTEEGTKVVRSLKYSPEELDELDKQSSVSTLNSSFQKPKPQEKDIPNGCFHLLFKGECARKEKCTYSHDPFVMAATHAHYEKLLYSSKYKPRTQESSRAAYGSVKVLQNANLGAVIDPAMDRILYDTFLAAFPGGSLVKHVLKKGLIDTLVDAITVPKVLFDTGALHASYIDKAFVDMHRDKLQHALSNCRAVARLADGTTTVSVDEVCKTTITVIDSKGQKHTATIPLLVLPSSTTDVIVGLPHILAAFGDLFRDMIDVAITEAEGIATTLDILEATADYKDIPPEPPPWTYGTELEAIEEIEVDLPSSFPWQLHYMEMPYEEALQEYFALFEEHINSEFVAQTDIINLLRTKGARVFVPNNWEGINGVDPIELNWKSDLPERMKPPARPVNPRLFAHSEKEYRRLYQYMYCDSTSPIASPLVIAPKATKPFIRFCGDYRQVNMYIHIGHYKIPIVKEELPKISKYKVFVDLDMSNSFHQLKLGPLTSSRLSIQTPWGQVEPKFMPEGVGPASFHLQSVVSTVFADFSEWLICIFDNILLLAHDYADAYRKLELVLDRCIERNVFLKFSKSWLGFDHANFFGYQVRHNCYQLSQSRKDGVMEIQFPRNLKMMQSFLGEALFFKSFVPDYSELTAPLHDMTRKDFDWSDKSTWKQDYEAVFVEFKKALCNALSLYYPEYDWAWILRVDASDIACGAILLQVRPSDGALLPINITSKKFSSTAQGWSTIEKEGFGCYHGIKSNDYLLRGKEFILETDHNNLVWIKTSEVPKIIRWRVYMQSFNFLIRHIRGSLNTIADYLSRMHTNPSTHHLNAIAEGGEAEDGHMFMTYVDLLRKVHGGRSGHWGVRQTWLALNKLYPGHRIPYKLVQDFVMSCYICQKDRLRQLDNIQPVTRHLHQDRPHRVVGIDHLTVTPEDETGNKVVIMIVDLFDKFVDPSPHKDFTAETAAIALFKHICNYGMIDAVASDPGSAFTSEVVEQVLKWLGPKHIISLVDVHTSSGVEPANREALRHLKALIYDERLLSRWSHDTVFPIIKFLINSHVSSETGMEPFRLRFGDRDKIFMQLPETNSLPENACEFVRQLNENLAMLRETSHKYQQEILDEKLRNEPPEEQQNQYQPGDYVLYHRGSAMHNKKLLPIFKGPYKVITHYRNDVTCRNLITDAIEPAFQASRLKMWHGTTEEAFKAAMLDNDQYVVDSIIAYRGDPDQRTVRIYCFMQ